jgi:hypothetical protein
MIRGSESLEAQARSLRSAAFAASRPPPACILPPSIRACQHAPESEDAGNEVFLADGRVTETSHRTWRQASQTFRRGASRVFGIGFALGTPSWVLVPEDREGSARSPMCRARWQCSAGPGGVPSADGA